MAFLPRTPVSVDNATKHTDYGSQLYLMFKLHVLASMATLRETTVDIRRGCP